MLIIPHKKLDNGSIFLELTIFIYVTAWHLALLELICHLYTRWWKNIAVGCTLSLLKSIPQEKINLTQLSFFLCRISVIAAQRRVIRRIMCGLFCGGQKRRRGTRAHFLSEWDCGVVGGVTFPSGFARRPVKQMRFVACKKANAQHQNGEAAEGWVNQSSDGCVSPLSRGTNIFSAHSPWCLKRRGSACLHFMRFVVNKAGLK